MFISNLEKQKMFNNKKQARKHNIFDVIKGKRVLREK